LNRENWPNRSANSRSVAGKARDLPPDFELAIAQARKAGYANCFEAVISDVILRPVRVDSDGRRILNPPRTARIAIVFGTDGGSELSGSDELYGDALGAKLAARWHARSTVCSFAPARA
jgi:type VI secretion system secreted protein VgrG